MTGHLDEAARLLRKARREMALDQLRTRFGVPQPPVGALNPRNPSDMDVIGWALAELLECVGDEAPGAAAMAQGGDVPSPHADTQVGDGVKPATDEDIAYHAAHPGPLSAQRVGELVARVRQEQARAEKAEREIDRLRPVVEAAVDWDMAMVDLDDLAVAVTEYRAARKEAGGKSWLPAQDFTGRSLRPGACPDCPPGGGECDVCGGTGRAAEDA